MARVQVRDLPDAPQLQATVQSGGNFGVSVQQAGRNKLMDLADTLSKVNPALQNYGAIAAIDAEMYEDELKRLKPEELSERLSKTEKELDSLSRKGAIPWLASPLNQKRKRRAEGKAAHDLFVQRLIDSEGRLENPQEGDNDKTTAQIIEEERQAFIAENPALQEGTYGGEGFQEVLNPTILNLTRQYDGEKARVAKAETLLQNTSAIYRLAKDAPLDSAEYDLVMEQSLRSRDGGAGPWAELNSFNAAQQIKVIENVAEQLANLPGGEQRAYEFLQYAEQNFYVGNQLFYKNEDQVDRIMNSIEREVEAAQRIREGGRDERLEIEQAEFVVALSAIQSTGKGTYKGVEYTDKFQLEEASQEFARKDGDIRFAGRHIQNIEQVIKGDLDMNQYQRALIRRESKLEPQVRSKIRSLIGNIVVNSDLPVEVKTSPRLELIESDVVLDFENKIKDKQDEMIRTGVASDPARAGSELDAFIKSELESINPILNDRVNRLAERVEKETKRTTAATAEQTFNETEPVTEPFLPKFLEDYGGMYVNPLTVVAAEAVLGDSQKQVTLNVLKNVNVASNEATIDSDRQTALNYIEQHKEKTLEALSSIAASSSPFSGMDKSEGVVEFVKLIMAPGEVKTNLTALKEKASEAKKEATEKYFQIARVFGVFQDVEVLRDKVTPHGLKFEFGDDVNSNNTVFLTKKQIESVRNVPSDPSAVPADIVEIATLVGESKDVLKFVRNQRDIVKSFDKILNK